MQYFSFFISFYSIQDDIKDGKAYVFWNLDSEFQNTVVVCLGKPCKGFDQAELICDDKDTVRAAASGKERLNLLLRK